MKKRILSIFLVLLVLVQFCGCSTAYDSYRLLPNTFLLGETLDENGDIVLNDNTPPKQLTVDDIQAMNNGEARMVFSDAGYLTFLNGKYYEKKVNDYEDAIKSIQGIALVLGLGAGSEFFCEHGAKDPNGYTYYTFKQRYGESTVQYATLRVFIDPEGYTAGLSCSFTPNLGIAEDVEWISAEEAERIISEGYNGLTVYPEYTTKVAVTINETLYSAYAVYTNNFLSEPTNAGLPYLEHFVAYDGTFLSTMSTSKPTDASVDERALAHFEGKQSMQYTGSVRMFDGSMRQITVPIAYSPEDQLYYLMDVERKIVVGDYASFVFQGYPNFSSSTNGQDWDNNHLLAYYNYIQVYDYYAARGIQSVDGTGVPILVLHDYVDQNGVPVNNACNLGIVNGFATFAASDANYYSETMDVIAHEFTHGVTGYTMGGVYYVNAPGAINEAYSDIMGNIVEMSLGATYDQNEWLIAEMSGSVMRNMSDPHKSSYPPQPTSLSDPYYWAPVPDELLNDADYMAQHDNGGVHVNNTLLSQMAYKLFLAGMSLEDQGTLWIGTMELITPLSEYEEVYEALLMCIDIYGFDQKYADLLTQEFIRAELLG